MWCEYRHRDAVGLVIVAILFDGSLDSIDAILSEVPVIDHPNVSIKGRQVALAPGPRLLVTNGDRVGWAFPGDYIIKGPDGYWPIPGDEFERNYEEVGM